MMFARIFWVGAKKNKFRGRPPVAKCLLLAEGSLCSEDLCPFSAQKD